MKKRYTALMILIILIAMTFITSSAAPPDSDGFIPDISALTPKSGITAIYSQYPFANYAFDIEEGKGFIDLNGVLNFIPNLIFLPLVLLTKMTTYMLVSCYKVNIYNIMPDAINNIVWAIKDGLFEGFYELVIVFSGVFGIYKTYQGAKTSGIKVGLSSILVFGLSTWFFLNPSALASGLNQGIEVISVKVLYEVTKVADPDMSGQIKSEDDAIVLMSNMFWEIAVNKPYELIQYGTIGKYDPNEFLKNEPGSDVRQDLANTYAKDNSYFTMSGVPARVAWAFVILIIGIIYNACILIIAATIAFNHFGSLVWICFAGLFFLAALYPSYGLKVLGKWAIETFGYLLKRLVITIALSIYFAIAMVIFSMANEYGLLAVLVYNIILLIFAITKYEKIYELLMGLFTGNQGMVNSGMQKESLAGKASKLAVTAYAGQKLYSNLKKGIEHNKQKSFEKHNKNKAVNVLTDQYNQDKQEAKRNSESKLTARYQKEKEEAEKRGERTNRPPEYSKFVQQADQREKNNLPMWTEKQIEENLEDSDLVRQVDYRISKGYTPFSDEQVKSKLNTMYKLKKEGNDPERLLYTNVEGKNGEQIKKDQIWKEQQIKDRKAQLNDDKRHNTEKIEDNIESAVGPHFKAQILAKSVARKGIRAIGENIKDSETEKVETDKETKVISFNEKIKEKVNTEVETEININEKLKNIKNIDQNTTKNEHKNIEVNATTNVTEKQNTKENHTINNTIETNKTTENIDTENIKETIKNIKTVELYSENVNTTQSSSSNAGISLGDVAMAAQLLTNKKKNKQNREQAEAVKSLMSKLQNQDTDLDNGSE